MKTWLRENPWRSKGFYAWVTSEFQAWVTSASGMREVWFPQREGSSRVAGGDSSAAGVAAGAEPALLTLGVPRAQPVPPSSTSGRAVRVKCLSQEQKYQAPSTSEVGQRGRGERLVHEKLETVTFPHVSAPAGLSNEKYWATPSTQLFCDYNNRKNKFLWFACKPKWVLLQCTFLTSQENVAFI